MVVEILLESIWPCRVQTAPGSAQPVVLGRVTVTSSPPSGWTVICHLRALPWVVRLALVTWPPVTVRTWSLTAASSRLGSLLKKNSSVKAVEPSWLAGTVLASRLAVSGSGTGIAAASLVSDSSLPSSSVKETRTLRFFPASSLWTCRWRRWPR